MYDCDIGLTVVSVTIKRRPQALPSNIWFYLPQISQAIYGKQTNAASMVIFLQDQQQIDKKFKSITILWPGSYF